MQRMAYNNDMKVFLSVIVMFLLSFPSPLRAQEEAESPKVAPAEKPMAPSMPEIGITNSDLYPERRCFTIYNTAPYNVHGSLYSDYFMTQYGTKGRDQSNFRLEPGQRMEHCSGGPFLGVNKDELYFVLRTLIPIFSCHIRAEGEIVISGRRKAEGGTDTWATCAESFSP